MNCHSVFNCDKHSHEITNNRLIKETVLNYVNEAEFKELFTIAALEKVETVTSSAIAATSSAIKASLDARNAVNDLTIQTIDFVNDAINNTAVEGGVLADTFVVVNGSMTQRTINRGLESIAELSTINNPKDGLRVYVKSYHANMNRGGGWFYYDSTKVSFVDEFDRTVTNDKGRFINGWVRIVENNEFTPEMFGAYGDAETLGHDDWQAIEDMFQSLMPCGTGSDMSWEELGNSWIRGQKRIVRIDRLFKHSKTLFIPPNIKIKQSNWQDPQLRKVTQGFWYSPPAELRDTTCAISNYLYKKIDTLVESFQLARWELSKDARYMPATYNELEDDFYAFGWGIEIDDLTVITDEDVVLGVRLIHAHIKTDGLTVGGFLYGSSYQNSKCPRVGLVNFHCYGSTHYNTRVRADVQGIVVGEANAGLVFYSPWITQTNRKQRSVDYVPVFKTDAHTETGSCGITYLEGEAHFESPIYENWNIHVLAIDSKYVSIYRPHNESMVLKHEFYLINSSMVADMKNSFGAYVTYDTFKDFDGSDVVYPNYSCIYLKNCNKECAVYIGGAVRYGGGVILRGENSVRVVELDYIITEYASFIAYGRIGDLSLLRKANWGELGFEEIIINSVTGNDDNSGFTRTSPRKSLKGIDVLVDRGGIKRVVIDEPITLTENIPLPTKPLTITGNQVTVSMGEFFFKAGETIDLFLERNLTFENTTAWHLIAFDACKGSVRIESKYNLLWSILRTYDFANIDLTIINRGPAHCTAYVEATTPELVSLGLNVVTTESIPETTFTPNICIKYKSANITQAI